MTNAPWLAQATGRILGVRPVLRPQASAGPSQEPVGELDWVGLCSAPAGGHSCGRRPSSSSSWTASPHWAQRTTGTVAAQPRQAVQRQGTP